VFCEQRAPGGEDDCELQIGGMAGRGEKQCGVANAECGIGEKGWGAGETKAECGMRIGRMSREERDRGVGERLGHVEEGVFEELPEAHHGVGGVEQAQSAWR
jgi:hypothetical protein